MAVYKVFLEKDAFIYSEIPTGSAGRDEILEIGSYPRAGVGQSKRTLIKYDSTELHSIIDNYSDIGSVSTELQLNLAEASEVPTSYTIEGYPLAEAWIEGIGRYGSNPIDTSGVSWYKSDGISNWSTLPITGVEEYQNPSGQSGGGIWLSDNTLHVSQTHTVTSTHDVKLDITPIVTAFYNDTIDNHGILLKLQDDLEFLADRQFILKYFSTQTHTVYPPTINIKWDDSTYNSNLTEISDADAVITVKGNKGEYVDTGKQRFRLNIRPRYPQRVFQTTSVYLDNFKLPEASHWGIRDEHTEEMVIDFDTTYTKISADNTSSYFDIFMEGLQPERYYRILVKTEIDGSTVVLDNNQVFKVIRNG